MFNLLRNIGMFFIFIVLIAVLLWAGFMILKEYTVIVIFIATIILLLWFIDIIRRGWKH